MLSIGVDSYNFQPSLPNCVKDASDIHSTALRMGYSGQSPQPLRNPTLIQAQTAIRDFCALVSRHAGASVMFYFSGHGTSNEHQNYLLLSDSSIDSLHDLEDNCVVLNNVVRRVVDSGARSVFFFLDCCRSNEKDCTWKPAATKDGQRVGLCQVSAKTTGSPTARLANFCIGFASGTANPLLFSNFSRFFFCSPRDCCTGILWTGTTELQVHGRAAAQHGAQGGRRHYAPRSDSRSSRGDK